MLALHRDADIPPTPLAVEASVLPARGVYCEPCVDRPGYVRLKVIDHCGVNVAEGTMPAEWCDQELLDIAHERLARIDPDYEQALHCGCEPVTRPSASELREARADSSVSSPPRWVRGRTVVA